MTITDPRAPAAPTTVPAIPEEALASAIVQTREVFASERAAGDALLYLKSVLHDAPRVMAAADADLRTAMLNTAAEVATTRAENERLRVRAGAAEDENWKLLERISVKDRTITTLEKQVLTLFGPAAAPAPAAAPTGTEAAAPAPGPAKRIDTGLAPLAESLERFNAAMGRAAHIDLARRYDKLEATNASLTEQLAAARACAAPGGGTASIVKETQTAAGAEPVASAAPRTVVGCMVVEVDGSQIDAALAKLGALGVARADAAGEGRAEKVVDALCAIAVAGSTPDRLSAASAALVTAIQGVPTDLSGSLGVERTAQ